MCGLEEDGGGVEGDEAETDDGEGETMGGDGLSRRSGGSRRRSSGGLRSLSATRSEKGSVAGRQTDEEEALDLEEALEERLEAAELATEEAEAEADPAGAPPALADGVNETATPMALHAFKKRKGRQNTRAQAAAASTYVRSKVDASLSVGGAASRLVAVPALIDEGLRMTKAVEL